MRFLSVILGLGATTLAGCSGTDDAPGGGMASGGAASGGASSGGVSSGGGDLGGRAGASGGAAGPGSGGATSGGTHGDAAADDTDAAGHRPDGGEHGPDGAPAPDGSTGASYGCSLILGIATTNEWFGGFEKVVDNARWELKFQDSAHIEKWADPANAVWSLPTTSPCAEHPDAPDRIVFMGTNYDYDTVELFLPKYVAVLNNVKSKYPSVKHFDVMTYTRAPGNQECAGANRPTYSYIKPAQDEAIAQFAAQNPGFVAPAPRWEVQSCSDFTLCPHLTGPANAALSKVIGQYFSTH